jgi:hypothetical protein
VNNLWIFSHSLMTNYSVIDKNLHNIIVVAWFDIVINSINRIMDAIAIHHHIFFLMRVSHHQNISLTG